MPKKHIKSPETACIFSQNIIKFSGKEASQRVVQRFQVLTSTVDRSKHSAYIIISFRDLKEINHILSEKNCKKIINKKILNKHFQFTN